MDILDELSSAWSTWQFGRLPEDFILWSKSIRWWARLGIGIQIVGIITLITEIVGPKRKGCPAYKNNKYYKEYQL